jgi:hypothetical protein
MAASSSLVALLLAAASSAFIPRASAQEVVALPSEIESVVSGGRWRTASAEGNYRIVVRTGGFEHVVSQVQVDWVAMPSGNEEQRVVASKVAETGSWRVLRTRVVRRGSTWYALVEAMETHFTPAARGTWELRLGPPGEVVATMRRK